MSGNRNPQTFDRDARSNNGYLYTTNAALSSSLSNRRISEAVAQLVDIRGKRVVDVGCGDGTYTRELLDRGPSFVLGIDAATDAIAIAATKSRDESQLAFATVDVRNLGSVDGHFDVAVVRGVLHHLDEPEAAVAGILRLADEVIIVEPNGYNPVLKIIEKVSRYHREHEEKSYTAGRLDRWCEDRGAALRRSQFIGLVPFFCPDRIARILKRLEPLVEQTPVLRALCCGQYVQVVSCSPR
jgi:SAM-dependent methyltransferase